MSTDRGRPPTVLAALFGLLALSNLVMFVPVTEDTGFVVFDQRLTGPANTVAGVVGGTILVVYATGIWRMRRWALPLGWCYGAFGS